MKPIKMFLTLKQIYFSGAKILPRNFLSGYCLGTPQI